MFTKPAPQCGGGELHSPSRARPALPLSVHQSLPHDETLTPDMDQILRLACSWSHHLLLIRNQKLFREEKRTRGHRQEESSSGLRGNEQSTDLAMYLAFKTNY